MFLKPNLLKKMMKEAYKYGGLVVARNGNAIYLGGGYWGVETLVKCIPNGIKAQIVEIAGELPAQGEAYRITKTEKQMELDFENSVKIDSDVKEIYISKLVLSTVWSSQVRILRDDDNKVMLIDDRIVEMIDNEWVNFGEGETEAEGPFYKANAVYWQNNACRLRVFERLPDDEAKDMMEAFEKIDLLLERRIS